jgi:hypothetical protein
MSDDNRRRWFRFSLRSMFVLVTVLCCWLGWEASVVKHRKQTLKEVQQKGVFQFMPAESFAKTFPPGTQTPPIATIPRLRSWLGDSAVQTIYYTAHYEGFSQAELDRLAKIFPEAQFVEQLAEPCHPGCFPSGTLVDSPRGRRLIEELKVGDIVTTFHSNGAVANAAIDQIFTTNNRLWRIQTDTGSLLTTATQPLCINLGTPRPAGKLKSGDSILRFDDGRVRPVAVRELSQTDRTERVFNIILHNAEVFIAGGFVARSKPPAEIASR